MTMYYARLTGDIGAGAYLDVQSVSTDATKTSVAMAGGWHTYGGNWYVEGIYHSLGYIENGVDYSLVHTDNNRIWGAYDEQFNAAWPTLDRGAADRTINLYSYIYCNVNGANREARAICTITVPHLPDEPTNLTATRQSDNRVALAWTAPTRTADGIAIDVQVDGGSWSTVAQLGSGTSYTYTGASADHSYKFRARASYMGAWSDYTAATAAVVMTPAAPTSISTAAAGGTTVDVTLVNPSPVATSIEYQVSTDGGETWGASATSANLTSFSVTISGTGKIRVRNVNATGSSAWLTSATVTTICPPAAPTPRTPSGIVDMDAANVTFGWLFNSLDGSAQTAYELQYAINGGATVALTGTTAKSRSVAMTTFSAGDSVSWKVRTKGADPDWSDWSTAQTFYVYTAPTVAITSPGATITGMPISLVATYSDMPGFTCAAATASLTQNGRTLYSEPADINGSAITASLDVAEFLPTNGESYTVVLDVRSSSSLYGSANATFEVDFTEPAAGDLQITNDGETGYVNLTALFDNHASDVTYEGTAGTGVTVQSAAVRSLAVDGMSVQDGTPTPDNPVPIQVVEGINLLTPQATQTKNGVTLTANADGSYTLDGTPTAGSWFTLDFSPALPAGTYTLSANNPTASAKASLLINVDGSFIAGAMTTVNKVRTVTASTGITQWAVVIATGETFNGFVIRPQIERGATAQPFVPYGALGLRVHGKNLAPTDGTKSAGGITFTENADKSITFSGSPTVASVDYYYLGYTSEYAPIEAGTYTISGCVGGQAQTSGAAGTYAVFATVRNSGGTILYYNQTNDPTTITIGEGSGIRLFIRVYSTNTGEHTIPLMFNKGGTALPYEPYYSSVTPIPLDGNVLASLPDGTHDVLNIDSAGHVTLTKSTGVIDLGSLNWTDASSPSTHVFRSNLYGQISSGDYPLIPSGNVLPNAIMQKYQRDTWSHISASSDGYFAMGIVSAANQRLAIVDNDYSDSSLFAASVSGEPLYYQLATPTTVDLGYIDLPALADGATVDVMASLATTFELVGYDGSADAASISVLRVNLDGSTTQLLDGGESGAALVDMYAPLNTPYKYAVVTRAASQAVKTVYFDNELASVHWFAYWSGKVARATWNPSGQTSITRPEKKRVHYVGREYPVSYDSQAIDQSDSMSWTILPADEADGFRELMRDGGRGVYKGCDGQVFHADFEYTSSADFWHITRNEQVSLTITRIDGEQL